MATPLPSASKPRRSRQSLTPSVPQIDKAQFTTPSARNWEEGGSFESVVEGLNELGLGVMEEEEEGVAEVEWMPPRSERESRLLGRQAVRCLILDNLVKLLDIPALGLSCYK